MLFPEDENIQEKDHYKRLVVPFTDNSQRFRFKSQNDYSKQFAHIYAARLTQMRGLLAQKSQEKWGQLT